MPASTTATDARPSFDERVEMLRRAGPMPLLSGVAAALSWFIADAAVGPEAAVFAPIAAVWTLGLAADARTLRALGVGLGVALGLTLGALVVDLIGDGFWQLGLVVVLARAAAILADGTLIAINQATITAVLVVALHHDGVFPGERFLDAFIGTVIALVAAAVLSRVVRTPAIERG